MSISKTEFDELKAMMTELQITQALILNQLEQMSQSCMKMDSHINFIDNVYATLRNPLSSLSRTILPALPPS